MLRVIEISNRATAREQQRDLVEEKAKEQQALVEEQAKEQRELVEEEAKEQQSLVEENRNHTKQMLLMLVKITHRWSCWHPQSLSAC